MKTKIILTAAAAIVWSAGFSVKAQDASVAQNNQNNYNSSSWWNSNANDLYRANEFSLDVFGAGASDARRHGFDFHGSDRHNVRGGGGGGLEYFFCRYIGLEAESFALANSHNTSSAVGGNLVLRLPIFQTGLSPYIFGGGGNEWTYKSETYADGGAGLEYRFTRSFGIFGDARFVSPQSTHDYGMGRLGVRFAF